MNDILLKKIDSLPPLPKTILDLEEFKKSSNKDLDVLSKILKQDPLIVATLLKVSNSAMFGFNNKVESPERAIHLLGVNFTLSIAFGSAIKNAFNSDLKAYNMTADSFMRLSNISSNLLKEWIGKIDNTLKEELLLPIFLCETGRFVLAGVATEKGIASEFYNKIKQNPTDIENIEKEYFGATSTQVTSSIFKHWNLSDSLVNIIAYISDIDSCPDEYKKDVQILNVVNTICNVTDPLGDKFIELGIEQAESFGLETRFLQKAIEKIQDRMLEE
ncbi:MAG: HDOD domain-containing protein [Arcobacter sp.]|nr:MAG: HDOD domain-containing protein [Arcobacter sp.]